MIIIQFDLDSDDNNIRYNITYDKDDAILTPEHLDNILTYIVPTEDIMG